MHFLARDTTRATQAGATAKRLENAVRKPAVAGTASVAALAVSAALLTFVWKAKTAAAKDASLSAQNAVRAPVGALKATIAIKIGTLASVLAAPTSTAPSISMTMEGLSLLPHPIRQPRRLIQHARSITRTSTLGKFGLDLLHNASTFSAQGQHITITRSPTVLHTIPFILIYHTLIGTTTTTFGHTLLNPSLHPHGPQLAPRLAFTLQEQLPLPNTSHPLFPKRPFPRPPQLRLSPRSLALPRAPLLRRALVAATEAAPAVEAPTVVEVVLPEPCTLWLAASTVVS